jgi:hypothetical protein
MLVVLVSLTSPFSTDIDDICYEETGTRFCQNKVSSFNAWKMRVVTNSSKALGTF